MCAVADLPTPKSNSDGMVVIFNMFPVKMKVLDAELGSCSKARAACCAATKALVVLILKSRVKSARGSESGFLGSFGVAAPALEISTKFQQNSQS